MTGRRRPGHGDPYPGNVAQVAPVALGKEDSGRVMTPQAFFPGGVQNRGKMDVVQ